MAHLRSWLFIAGLCAGLASVAYLSSGTTAQALKPSPLFVTGQTYAFVWDCFPNPPLPCFAEALTVLTVRPDGWVEVYDPMEHAHWTVNPIRAIAIQPMPIASQQASP